MNHRMRDHIMARDERNPYGSQGGYVSPDRMYDRGYEERDYRRFYDSDERRSRRGDRSHHMNVRYDGGSGYYEGEFRGMTDNDYMYRGDHRRDRIPSPDFGSGYLSKHELHEWQCELCRGMNQDECNIFEYDTIIHEAESIGMIFDRFNKEEFYTTVLMLYSDYCKTCGQDPIMYIKMAKDFLEDHDARYKFGEKLAAYYDTFVK